MKHLKSHTLALGCLLLAANAQAANYLIDFNTAQGGAYPDASTWNIYADTGDVTGTLADSTGSTSAGISIGGAGDFLDSSGTGLYNAGVGAPAWTNSAAPAGDFFWTGNDSGATLSFTVTFGGFTGGEDVSLDIFASRDSALSLLGNYEYSLDGGTNWAGFDVLSVGGSAVTTDGWDTNTTQTQTFDLDGDGYTLGRYMNIADVEITGTDFQVRVTSPITVSNYAGINSMQLTVVPEPATIFIPLFTLAAVAAIARRKRSVSKA